jgi:photosystem II stability/assembly factor-like uncharacterized protein
VANSISCVPGGQTCVAVSSAGFTTTKDGGKTWAWSGVPKGFWPADNNPGEQWSAADCPLPTQCIVVGTAAGTANGGALQVAHNDVIAPVSYPVGLPPLLAVVCGTPSWCVASGGDQWPRSQFPDLPDSADVVQTYDGGATWAAANLPTGNFLLGIACPSSTKCIVVGHDQNSQEIAVVTADQGKTWSTYHLGMKYSAADVLPSVVCPTTTTCFVYGGNGPSTSGTIAKLTGTRTSWGVTATDHLAGYVDDVACPSSAKCVAIMSPQISYGAHTCPPWRVPPAHVLRTTDGGSTWKVVAALDQNQGNFCIQDVVTHLACLSANWCMALGPDATTYLTRDGGSTWATASQTWVGLSPESSGGLLGCVELNCYAFASGTIYMSALNPKVITTNS